MFRLQQPRRAHANELKSVLESHFVEAGHILVFLDIIEQPANSKRAWCIFESFSKIHHALLDRAAVAHDHHPYRIMVIGNSKLSGEFFQRFSWLQEELGGQGLWSSALMLEAQNRYVWMMILLFQASQGCIISWFCGFWWWSCCTNLKISEACGFDRAMVLGCSRIVLEKEVL